MDNVNVKDMLVDLLKKKSTLKQDIYRNTKEWFNEFKASIEHCVEIIEKDLKDDKIRLRYVEKSESEAQLYIGSDVLVFTMHTNVFKFSGRDFASKTSYVTKYPENAYCGVINIYDFLADSYEFNRPNDLGYLIGRIFVNRENHFLMEGKGQLGFLYRDFMHQVITKEIVEKIVHLSAIHALQFDLLNPPYETVNQVSVYELQTLSHSSELKTGKRLGFKFKSNHNVS